MERYCALGRLLPVDDDIDFIDDVSANRAVLFF
jgi:hypothetical protein